MSVPIWLQDESEILALLNAALDRFDQLPGSDRTRATLLSAEHYLPSLRHGGSTADQTWGLINELRASAVLTIRASRRSAFDPAWHKAKLAFDASSETILREWLHRPQKSKPMDEWREAVSAHANKFPYGIGSLLERRIVIANRNSDEIVQALASLATITTAATLRQLSTHAFWGDSKVLDERGDLIAALFPHLQIRQRPIVVAVHLPNIIEGVLFIENQDTYTAAIDGEPVALQSLALVYLSGFKTTAQRIRERSGARLHFSGAASAADEFALWWFMENARTHPVYFWGDLDFSGMQMLKSLRERFGNITAWRPGYQPMVERLAALHRNAGDSNRQQSDPVLTGCAYADSELLPLIRKLGFWDQERIGLGDKGPFKPEHYQY